MVELKKLGIEMMKKTEKQEPPGTAAEIEAETEEEGNESSFLRFFEERKEQKRKSENVTREIARDLLYSTLP